jgi:hypothetical protein
LTTPLTVVTSSGLETTACGVSSGVSDQSVLNWPINTCEVVIKVDKNSPGAGETSGRTRSPSSSSPLSSGFDSEQETAGSENVSTTRGRKRGTAKKEEIDDETDEATGASNREATGGGKSTVFIKLITSGSSGSGVFDPVGLATYIQRLEEKISSVERLLAEEISSRDKWEIEDQRRTHDYDGFIKTFLTLLWKEGHVAQADQTAKTTKNGKAKGRGGKTEKRGAGAGTAGRKRKS